MSIADDIRDRRAPYVPAGKGAQRTRSSRKTKERNTRIAMIRRIAEARAAAAALTAADKSEGMAGVVRQLAQKERDR